MNKKTGFVLTIVFLFFLFICFFNIVYANRIHDKNTKDKVIEYLTQQKVIFQNEVNNDFVFLQQIATFFVHTDIVSDEEKLKFLKKNAQNSDFSEILLSDLTGNAVSSFGLKTDLNTLPFFTKQNKHYMPISDIFFDALRNQLVISISIYKDGEYVSSLHGIKKDFIMKNIIVSNREKFKSFFAIVNQYGDIIAHTNIEEFRNSKRKNYLEYLENRINDASVYATIEEDINQGNRNFLTFYDLNKEKNFVYYEPLNAENWTMLIEMNMNDNASFSNVFLNTQVLLTCLAILMFIIFVAILFKHNRKVLKGYIAKEKQLDFILDNTKSAVVQISLLDAFHIQYASEGISCLTGFTKKEIRDRFGNSLQKIIHRDDVKNLKKNMELQVDEKGYYSISYRLLTKNNVYIWVYDVGTIIEDNVGNQYSVAIISDIQKMQGDFNKIKELHDLYATCFTNMNCVMFDYNLKNQSLIFSDNCKDIFGEENVDKLGIVRDDLVHSEDKDFLLGFREDVYLGKNAYAEFRLLCKNNVYRWFRVGCFYYSIQGSKHIIGKLELNNQNHSSQNYSDIRIEINPQTGLLKLDTVKKYIQRLLSNSSNNADYYHALYLIQIDSPDGIVKNYGNQCYNIALIHVAEALKSLFRASDLIGTIRSDEFIVFLRSTIDQSIIEKKAKEICDVLSCIVIDKETEEHLNINVGISVYPDDAFSYTDLYNAADSALFIARKKGKNQYSMKSLSVLSGNVF